MSRQASLIRVSLREFLHGSDLELSKLNTGQTNDLLDDLRLAPWSRPSCCLPGDTRPSLAASQALSLLRFQKHMLQNSALNSWVFQSGLIWGLSWCELTLSLAYFRVSSLHCLCLEWGQMHDWLPVSQDQWVAHLVNGSKDGIRKRNHLQAGGGRQACTVSIRRSLLEITTLLFHLDSHSSFFLSRYFSQDKSFISS